MALIGVIVGYGVAMGTNGSFGGAAAPAQVADVAAPTAPTPPAEPTTADNVKPVDKKTDHILGDPNSTISIIEYSDYECPFCARNHPTVKQLVTDNDDVNLVYRHYPLSFHANAQATAEGSECVASLGGNDAFWKFTEAVFDQGADKAKLRGYAESAGVSGTKFDDCMNSGKFTQAVNDHFAEGSAAGVNGTPGNIIINNKTGKTRMVSGAQPAANFQAAIDALR